MQREAMLLLSIEQKENGEIKLSKIIEYGNGTRVQVPLNRGGSIKWFDDAQLIKPEYR